MTLIEKGRTNVYADLQHSGPETNKLRTHSPPTPKLLKRFTTSNAP